MAVAVDAVSTASTQDNGGVSTLDVSTITVGSGSNRALVLGIAGVGNPTAFTAIWDPAGANQSMTQITNSFLKGTNGANPNTVLFFGLVAPTSGAKVCRIAWTTSTAQMYFFLISFTGVDQTGGATSFANGATAQGTGAGPASVTGTSATGNIGLGIFALPDQAVTATNQTQLVLDSGNAGPTAFGMNRAAGAASLTMTGTLGGSSAGWVASFADVVAAAAAGTGRSRIIGGDIPLLGAALLKRNPTLSRRGLLLPGAYR